MKKGRDTQHVKRNANMAIGKGKYSSATQYNTIQSIQNSYLKKVSIIFFSLFFVIIIIIIIIFFFFLCKQNQNKQNQNKTAQHHKCGGKKGNEINKVHNEIVQLKRKKTNVQNPKKPVVRWLPEVFQNG